MGKMCLRFCLQPFCAPISSSLFMCSHWLQPLKCTFCNQEVWEDSKTQSGCASDLLTFNKEPESDSQEGVSEDWAAEGIVSELTNLFCVNLSAVCAQP